MGFKAILLGLVLGITVCEGFESYRLPNTTKPTHYDLFIDTNIHKGDLDYNGTVKIYIDILQDTKQLVLHSSRSTLVNVELKSSDLLNIPVVKFDTEIEKEFLIVHVASDLKNGSSVVLEIDFINSINRTDQAGFYQTSYTTDANVVKYAGLTQFQACEARSAFPCYDEPGIKTTFDLRITCGIDYHARANSEIASTTIISDSKKLVKFKRSPKMQTYLLAFLVSDFAVKRDYANSTKRITVQSLARPTHADQLDYSVDAAVKLMDELQSYFDHPYELSKVDNVAIRNNDFSAGAMENWGLVTYLESFLLVNAASSESAKRDVVTVIAHEFAHQFFGNLLAPKWWSYLWLNEGFATLYEYYLADRTHPDLLIKDRFTVVALQEALSTDSSITVRAMTHYVETVPEIDRLFDRIAYSKSGSVLRMMHYALGEPTFVKGLRHYIKKNQNSVVEPLDLYSSLQNATTEDQSLPTSLTIATIMSSWADQPGVPVVMVERVAETDEFKFTQKRFLYNPNSMETNQTWWIPIFVYTNSSAGSYAKKPLFWIPQGTPELKYKIPAQENDVIIFNPAQVGYYRVNYDTTMWNNLIEILCSFPESIDPATRGQLIDDSMNLANAGLLDHETSFKILDHLQNNTDFLPWKSAYRNILQLDKMLASDKETLELLHKYIIQLSTNLFESYGLKERAGENTHDHDTRLIAIDLSCRIGQQTCKDYADSKKTNILDQRTHRLVIRSETEQRWFCNALRGGRELEVELFQEALEVEEDSQARSHLINSLACIGDRKLLEQVMEKLSEQVSNSEMFSFMAAAAEDSSVGMEAVVGFLTERRNQMDDFFSNTRAVERLISKLAEKIVDRTSAERLLMLARVLHVAPDLEATLSGKLAEQIHWKERNVPLVRAALEKYHGA